MRSFTLSLPEIVFDEANHLYTINGERAAGVTTVIGQLQRIKIGDLAWYVDRYNGTVIDGDKIEGAGGYGTAIHKGCQMIAEGKSLDFSTMPDLLRDPLSTYGQFLSDYGIEPVFVELVLGCDKDMVGGTVDLVAWWCGKLAIIDIKTGSSYGLVDIQLAKYEDLFRKATGYTGKIIRAVVTPPSKDGSGRWKIKATGTGKQSLKTFNAMHHIYKELRA